MAVYNYIQNTGVILVDTADILTQVQNEYKALFGQNLNVDPSTPQGMLITAESLGRDGVAQNNATLANQINPNIAGGQFLFAIGMLTNSPPQPATFTRIPAVLLTGVPGTFIPAGSEAQLNTTGEIFASLANVTLDVTGEGQSDFQALVAGAVPVPVGTLTIIVQGGVDGWETVYNDQVGIVGQTAQSDEQYRLYRRETLGLQGKSVSESVISRVRAVPGVLGKPSYLENVSNTTQIISGITLVAHSIYVCVDGGSDDDVANALRTAKTAGANYNGSTVVTQIDPATGQVYTVKFDRPTSVPILVQVTILSNPLISDPTNIIKAAILDYANGLLNNEAGLAVGISVSPFELAGAINQEAPTIFVKKVEVSYGTGPVNYVTTTLPIALNERASILASAINVVITN